MTHTPTLPCAELSAGEPLAGTATQAERWLLVETRGAWQRDAGDHGLPDFEGRTMLVRRPDRRAGPVAVYVARASEEDGELRRVPSLDELEGGELLAEPLLLICCHGRRDACCARLGTPVFDVLRHVMPGVWQSSHHGGHRFAANMLALPAGIQLGRVRPGNASDIARVLLEGRIPLDHYRGRTLYSPRVQAAEVAVRRARGLDRLADLRLVSDDGHTVEFSVEGGDVACVVEASSGAVLPLSCGAEPESTTSFRVTL